MKKLFLAVFLSVLFLLVIRPVGADTPVNVQLHAGDSVFFTGEVVQDNRILIELQSTGTPINFFVLTSDEFVNWRDGLTFVNVFSERAIINSSTPKMTNL